MSDMEKLVRLFRQMEDELGDWQDWLIAGAIAVICLAWMWGVALQIW